MQRILDMTDDTIVFTGRFYLEPETLPIDALLYKKHELYKCTITHKEILEFEDDEDEDPHKGAFYDEDIGGYIRLSPPDKTIEIKYIQHGLLEKTPEDDEFFARATESGPILERNRVFESARKDREAKEDAEQWRRENPELAAKLDAWRAERDAKEGNSNT